MLCGKTADEASGKCPRGFESHDLKTVAADTITAVITEGAETFMTVGNCIFTEDKQYLVLRNRAG